MLDLVGNPEERFYCIATHNYMLYCSAQAHGHLCEEAGNYGDNVKYCGYCVHHYKKLVSRV